MSVLRVAGLTAAGMLLVASPAAAGSVWSVVASPNVAAYFGNPYDELNGVAAVSSTDVWAVGDYLDGQRRANQTLAEHWDGTAWHVVSSPNRSGASSVLAAAGAVSSADVWAVGGFQNVKDYATSGTLIEHWNGRSWKIVSSPNATAEGDSLTAVAARSSNDVWAVGGGGGRTLAEHWNGVSWSLVPTPNPPGPGNLLTGVAAVSGTDVWAVGRTFDGLHQRTLIEHWDGGRWTIVPNPNASAGDNVLNVVAAVSSRDVWAAGSFFAASGDTQTLVEHWNGTSWTVVPSPNPAGATSSVLSGMAAVFAGKLWAVGGIDVGQYTGSTLTEQWNGTTWSVVPSPNPAPDVNVLRAVAALPSGEAWAVGRTGQSRTLILHTTG
jgi:hypothetical protein